KLSLGEKISFSCHAVRTQSASKVINHLLWWNSPSCIESRENIIAAFTAWHRMKTIAYGMCTPGGH
ncbi:hypothetical protein BDQ17DRAFT_1189578, partial [Cyathus striatus]